MSQQEPVSIAHILTDELVIDASESTVQDHTPTGRHQYNNVFYFLIAMKAMDVGYGLFYHVSRCNDLTLIVLLKLTVLILGH